MHTRLQARSYNKSHAGTPWVITALLPRPAPPREPLCLCAQPRQRRRHGRQTHQEHHPLRRHVRFHHRHHRHRHRRRRRHRRRCKCAGTTFHPAVSRAAPAAAQQAVVKHHSRWYAHPLLALALVRVRVRVRVQVQVQVQQLGWALHQGSGTLVATLAWRPSTSFGSWPAASARCPLAPPSTSRCCSTSRPPSAASQRP